MPFVTVHGHRLHYRCEGPEAAPVVVFSNSLGAGLAMWDPQAAALRHRYRVLRYDTRGQGESEVTPGSYTADQLGRDVLGLLDALGIDACHFCGLSMGGLIAQWFAINAGNRLRKLILANTAARIGTPAGWDARIEAVAQRGMRELASSAVERWFTPEFARMQPQAVDAVLQPLRVADPAGYIANCAAIRDADFDKDPRRIAAPLLFLAGTFDPVTTVENGLAVVKRVPGARLMELPASHLSNIEAAGQFNAALLEFLES